MNHIFDNRQLLQSFVVNGGNKISVTGPSRKHIISAEDVKRIFIQHLNDTEITDIKTYLLTHKKNKVQFDTVEMWCDSIIENSLAARRLPDFAGKINLKEFFIERVVSEGCAKAIIFLHKYYYKIGLLSPSTDRLNKHQNAF